MGNHAGKSTKKISSDQQSKLVAVQDDHKKGKNLFKLLGHKAKDDEKSLTVPPNLAEIVEMDLNDSSVNVKIDEAS